MAVRISSSDRIAGDIAAETMGTGATRNLITTRTVRATTIATTKVSVRDGVLGIRTVAVRKLATRFQIVLSKLRDRIADKVDLTIYASRVRMELSFSKPKISPFPFGVCLFCIRLWIRRRLEK